MAADNKADFLDMLFRQHWGRLREVGEDLNMNEHVCIRMNEVNQNEAGVVIDVSRRVIR